MAWTGTNKQAGKLQRCTICKELVHMSKTLKHDRENHRAEGDSRNGNEIG